MANTSISLLERASGQRDSASWQRLVDIYTPLLSGWLQRQGLQPHDADDVIQDVLLFVSKELPSFRHNGHAGAFRCWLRQILVHRLRKCRAAQERQPLPPGGTAFLKYLNHLEDPASDQSRLWDRQHDRHVVHQLLRLVRPRFAEASWEAFRRTVLCGESPSTVATELGMTTNAVYAVRFRVLRQLRQEGHGLIESTGIFSESSTPA